jgi:hypothetical protein
LGDKRQKDIGNDEKGGRLGQSPKEASEPEAKATTDGGQALKPAAPPSSS